MLKEGNPREWGRPSHAEIRKAMWLLGPDGTDEIREALAAVFATRPRDHWVDLLGPADTCVAPVNTVAEAVADPHTEARGLVADAVSDSETSELVRRSWGFNSSDRHLLVRFVHVRCRFFTKRRPAAHPCERWRVGL